MSSTEDRNKENKDPIKKTRHVSSHLYQKMLGILIQSLDTRSQDAGIRQAKDEKTLESCSPNIFQWITSIRKFTDYNKRGSILFESFKCLFPSQIVYQVHFSNI
jgi:hypothetical protein